MEHSRQFDESPQQAPAFDPHSPQLAMFMTPHEIKTHYKPLEGDRQRNQGLGLQYGERETDAEVWKRKARESDEQGLTANIKKHGVLSPVQLQMGSSGSDQGPEVLGGHHRIAAAPEHSLIPVTHHQSFFHAVYDPHYPYERAAGVGRW